MVQLGIGQIYVDIPSNGKILQTCDFQSLKSLKTARLARPCHELLKDSCTVAFISSPVPWAGSWPCRSFISWTTACSAAIFLAISYKKKLIKDQIDK